LWGWITFFLNDYPDGIKWLEKSVGFDRTNKDAWYFLGRAYYTKARFADAHQAFQKVLDLDPRNVRAEDNIGLIYETSGDAAAETVLYVFPVSTPRMVISAPLTAAPEISKTEPAIVPRSD
jgi:tetratricopeptide (TPR) repeat protein